MKHNGFKLCYLEVIVLFFCVINLLQAAEPAQQNTAQKAPDVKMNCDAKAERLSVSAERISLKWLFNEIASQCNIDVQFDEEADDIVSVNIDSVELEKAVKSILKGRNYILMHTKNAQSQLTLSTVMVLPDGDEQLNERVNAMDDEDNNRVLSQMSLQQTQQIEAQKKRWQVHLENMSPERRNAMEKRITDRVIANAKHKQKNQEYKQARQQQRAEKQLKQQQALELERQNMSEEERAIADQYVPESNEELRMQLRSQL